MRSATVLLLVWASRAEAELPVSLSVAPEAPCVTLESLGAQLAREGLTITESGALDVDVSASPSGVRLRARRQDDGRLLVRSVPARTERCEGVERALVMLIREWARAPQLVSPKISRPVQPAPLPVVAARPKEQPAPEAIELDAGVVVVPEPVVVEPEPVAIDAGVVLAAAPTVKIPAPAVTPVVPWQVRLAVAGGISAATTPLAAPAGSIVLDVGREAWGGSIDGTIEGAVVLASQPGQVSMSFQWLTLSARWRFATEDRFSLDLGVGVRGSRFEATASGFTTNGKADRYSVGPAATATAWFRLLGPVQAMVRASAALRLPADDRVAVEGGPSFPLSPAQLAVVAGLGVGWP